MQLGNYLRRLTKPELEFLQDNCNFTYDETKTINKIVEGQSDTQISNGMNVSLSTITKRKRKIFNKIIDYMEACNEMTTVYVNGERVSKDKLSEMKIEIDRVKQILAEKLTKSE